MILVAASANDSLLSCFLFYLVLLLYLFIVFVVVCFVFWLMVHSPDFCFPRNDISFRDLFVKRPFCTALSEQLGDISWQVVCTPCCHRASVLAIIYHLLIAIIYHLLIRYYYPFKVDNTMIP